MAAVDTVFEQLGKMSVLELVELKKKIEDEWGITAAAPVAVAAAGTPAGGGDGAAAEEQSAFDVIMGELASFGAHLETKPMLMVASKIDVANKDKLAQLKGLCKKHKWKLYEISAVTGKGIEQLKYAIAESVQELRDQSGSGLESEAS